MAKAQRRTRPGRLDDGERGNRHELDLDSKLRERGYWFDRDEADRFCAFCEKYVKHHKGEWAGRPLVLAKWQRRACRRLFGWRRPDGTRRYRRASWWIPRKNGKSTIAAAIGLYLLACDGEAGAEVYVLAANKEQASIIFDDSRRTVNASPDLAAELETFQTAIVYPRTFSSFKVLSGAARGKHGKGPSGTLIDELHEFSNRKAFDAMTTGSASRRQPLTFSISTAGDDINSLCFEEYDHARKLRDGVLEDPHTQALIFEAEAGDDWRKEATWRKANPNLGESVSLEWVRERCNEAIQKPGQEPGFRQFHCNQWVHNVTRWLNMEDWHASSGPRLKPAEILERFKGRVCYGGLDLSKTTDLSALVLVAPNEGAPGCEVLAKFWCPEESIAKRSRVDRVDYELWVREGWLTPTPGNVVDRRFVLADIVELSKTVKLEEIAYDRWGADWLVQTLQDDHGFTMIDHGQGFVSMAAPTAELERLVVGRLVRHFSNPILRWCISNTVVRVDPAGNMKPDKGRSTERIDGTVALIEALSRATVVSRAEFTVADLGVLNV
jgi:phage terminase large subunit-like protein